MKENNNFCIYKIINIKTDSIYIFIREFNDNSKYKGEDFITKRDLRIYGKRSFSVDILAKELTINMAEFLIKEYQNILNAIILDRKQDTLKEENKNLKENKEHNKSSKKKKVICITNGLKFDSATEASKFYNLKSHSSISKSCNDKTYAGIDKDTGEKLKWMYLEEYEAIMEGREYINYRKLNRISTVNTGKKVMCINTGENFDSIKEASQKYNIKPNSISQVCKGKRYSAGKHPETGEKLEWRYINNN